VSSAFATGDLRTSTPGGGIWHSLNRIIITLIILGACVPIAYSFLPEVANRKAQMQRIEALKVEIEKQRMQIARFEREEMLLKRDPEFISVIARDKLELMKDGETIYRLDDPQLDPSKFRKQP
jgi:cell division protein FtsB